ncbi:MAG: hypothetical protein K8R46_13790 [Pirellulales bacterium]|nr:hypothetical protein [Pirellulales bacterium]
MEERREKRGERKQHGARLAADGTSAPFRRKLPFRRLLNVLLYFFDNQ